MGFLSFGPPFAEKAGVEDAKQRFKEEKHD